MNAGFDQACRSPWTQVSHGEGIHWGTFALAEEPYDEPPRRLRAEVERHELDPEAIWVLKPGEVRHW